MEVRHDDRGINTDCGSVFIGEFRPKQTNVRKIFAYQTCAINTRFVANVTSEWNIQKLDYILLLQRP